jgi:solute carrier family 41
MSSKFGKSVKKGSIVIFIIITAKKYNVNPDNIATPIAASLGDAVTLILLSLVGNFFYQFSKKIILN